MVTHPKAGEIVWNNVKDNAVGEKDEYREIGLRGFDYKPFKEEGGRQERSVEREYMDIHI